jgi:hypothetical protein
MNYKHIGVAVIAIIAYGFPAYCVIATLEEPETKSIYAHEDIVFAGVEGLDGKIHLTFSVVKKQPPQAEEPLPPQESNYPTWKSPFRQRTGFNGRRRR